MSIFLATSDFGRCAAGLVMGGVFGVITAVGAFFAFAILSILWTQFTGQGLRKAGKFAAFIVVGVLFLGLGGLFGPLALGIYGAVGVASDSSTPPNVDDWFFTGYFGTVLAYLILGWRSCRTSASQ